MPRQQRGGHNHVLEAIANAIHKGQSYKGRGGGWQQPQRAGRNCPKCGDYNFEHRTTCRMCNAALPPPQGPGKGGDPAAAKGSGVFEKAQKGNYKGGGTPWQGAGNPHSGKGPDPWSNAGGAPVPAAASGASHVGEHKNAEGSDDQRDPAERIKEIRAEEERLRRTKAQFAETNPRVTALVDEELAALAAEREKLQPLEVNLQAAAGRTAHARAFLAKAREKREVAAKSLREKLDALKEADKEVEEAEKKLQAAEAAATAKRSETTFTGVQEAFTFIQRSVAEKCQDESVAKQVAAALGSFAQLLGIAANADGGDVARGQTEAAGQTGGPGTASAAEPPKEGSGAAATTGDGSPARDNSAGAVGGGGNATTVGKPAELYAGGPVAGEVSMQPSNKRGYDELKGDDDLIAQATEVLGDDL